MRDFQPSTVSPAKICIAVMLQISACEARSPPLPARKARDIREDEDTVQNQVPIGSGFLEFNLTLSS